MNVQTTFQLLSNCSQRRYREGSGTLCAIHEVLGYRILFARGTIKKQFTGGTKLPESHPGVVFNYSTSCSLLFDCTLFLEYKILDLKLDEGNTNWRAILENAKAHDAAT